MFNIDLKNTSKKELIASFVITKNNCNTYVSLCIANVHYKDTKKILPKLSNLAKIAKKPEVFINPYFL